MVRGTVSELIQGHFVGTGVSPLGHPPPVIERGQRQDAGSAATPRAEDPWAVKNARAIQLLGAGDLAAAVALFSQCVAGEPEEPVYRANLAEALARLAQREHEEIGRAHV